MPRIQFIRDLGHTTAKGSAGDIFNSSNTVTAFEWFVGHPFDRRVRVEVGKAFETDGTVSAQTLDAWGLPAFSGKGHTQNHLTGLRG